jgi:hypothetical protein
MRVARPASAISIFTRAMSWPSDDKGRRAYRQSSTLTARSPRSTAGYCQGALTTSPARTRPRRPGCSRVMAPCSAAIGRKRSSCAPCAPSRALVWMAQIGNHAPLAALAEDLGRAVRRWRKPRRRQIQRFARGPSGIRLICPRACRSLRHKPRRSPRPSRLEPDAGEARPRWLRTMATA